MSKQAKSVNTRYKKTAMIIIAALINTNYSKDLETVVRRHVERRNTL